MVTLPPFSATLLIKTLIKISSALEKYVTDVILPSIVYYSWHCPICNDSELRPIVYYAVQPIQLGEHFIAKAYRVRIPIRACHYCGSYRVYPPFTLQINGKSLRPVPCKQLTHYLKHKIKGYVYFETTGAKY